MSATSPAKTALPSSSDLSGSEQGFFSQGDWEFELDTLTDRSVEALRAHLAKAPDDACPLTVGSLRQYLIDAQGVTFTPFTS